MPFRLACSPDLIEAFFQLRRPPSRFSSLCDVDLKLVSALLVWTIGYNSCSFSIWTPGHEFRHLWPYLLAPTRIVLFFGLCLLPQLDHLLLGGWATHLVTLEGSVRAG